MRALIRLLGAHARGLLIFGTLVGVVSGLGNAAIVAIAQRALQTASPSRAVAALFALLCIGVLLARLLALVVLARLPPRTLHEVRMQVSGQLLHTPLAQLEKIGVGGLQALVTQDVSTVVNGLLAMPPLLIAVAALLACFVYTAWLSFELFCFVGVIIGVTFVARTMLDLRATRSFMRAMEEQAQLFGLLNDQVAGSKELHLSAPLRESFRRALIERSRSHAEMQAGAMTRLTAGNIVVEAGFQTLLATVIFVAPLFLGDAALAVRTGGTMVCFFLYSQLQIVNLMLPATRGGAMALARIEGLRLALGTTSSAPPPPALAPPAEIGFHDISLRYQGAASDESFQLGPTSLTLRRGEILFVIGGNGSGKSTLAKILCGLYAPDEGRILLDGVALRDDQRSAYRELFSTVFADFHLFEVLPAGVELGRAGELLRDLHLEGKVHIDGGVFSTRSLSQGQRKRMALLVAYLEDRPIYLFDEWAADQDPAFRKVFYETVLPSLKAKGKFVIAITHDDRYFRLADRIIKLESGRVVADANDASPSDGRSA